MTEQASGRGGVLVYAAVAIVGSSAVAAVLRTLHLSVEDSRAAVFVLAAMWMPALARLVATKTVDREWRPPFPLRRWGEPRLAVVLVPLAIVSAIYIGAYAVAWVIGVPLERPAWPRDRVILNIAVNLPLLAAIGMLGSLGEEIGWRGYLQPRLDQLEVSGSMVWVIAAETLFHLPLMVFAGYLESEAPAASVALAIGEGLGSVPLLTWATYRWRSIWIAAWFHTWHNAVSQVLVPKALGAGNPLVLGESGVLPGAFYLLAAAAIFGIAWARGERWRDLVRRALIIPT